MLLHTVNGIRPSFVTPRMSDAQILVISTTVNAKKVHPNASNLGSEHQNKFLTGKLLRIRLLQSDKCLNKGI